MAWRYKRDIERSLLIYIRENVNNDWTGISVGLSFNYTKHTPPRVCSVLDSGTHKKLELGTPSLNSKDLAIIDLYCTGDGQRLDLAAYLLDILKGGFPFYDFSPNPADPDNLLKVQKGWVYVDFVADTKVTVDVNAEVADKYRHRINCELQRNLK